MLRHALPPKEEVSRQKPWLQNCTSREGLLICFVAALAHVGHQLAQIKGDRDRREGFIGILDSLALRFLMFEVRVNP